MVGSSLSLTLAAAAWAAAWIPDQRSSPSPAIIADALLTAEAHERAAERFLSMPWSPTTKAFERTNASTAHPLSTRNGTLELRSSSSHALDFFEPLEKAPAEPPLPSDKSNITGAVCTGNDPVPAGSMITLTILIMISFCVLLGDYFDVLGIYALREWLASRCSPCCWWVHPDTGADETPRSPARTGGPVAGGAAQQHSKTEDAVGKDDAEEDDSPRSMSMASALTIVFTIVPSFVGDLYFSMLAPFLPGTASARGVSSAVIGLIFACHPIGTFLTSFLVPVVLRQPDGDPFVLLRRATLANAILTATFGFAGKLYVAWHFALVLCLLRFCQGVCVAFLDITNETITLKLLPRSYVGPVQGITMAVRILGVIAGPPIGGYLYEAGCWALPFTFGTALLLVAAIVLLLGLARSAPQHVRAVSKELTMWSLLTTGDTWLLVVPTTLLSMMNSFLEPNWQGFLGVPPFDLGPAQIGLFLNYAVICYTLVLVCAGALLPCIGPALQTAVGALIAAIGLLFIGPSPWFGSSIPQTELVVLAGTMTTYAGLGVAIPAGLPLALEIYTRAGFSQKQVAGVSSALFVAMLAVANSIGPPVGGALVEALGGVPATTTTYFIVACVVALPCIMVLCFKYIRRPDKGCCANQDLALHLRSGAQHEHESGLNARDVLSGEN